jgi:hypothetical protein
MKIRVWNANQIDDSSDSPERTPDRCFVIWLPDGEICQRITTEHLFQSGQRPTDGSVGLVLLA